MTNTDTLREYSKRGFIYLQEQARNSRDGVIMVIPTRILIEAGLSHTQASSAYQYLKRLKLIRPLTRGRGAVAFPVWIDVKASFEEVVRRPVKNIPTTDLIKAKQTAREKILKEIICHEQQIGYLRKQLGEL